MEFCCFLRSVTLEVRFLRLFFRAPCLPVVTAESAWPLFFKNWRISVHLSLRSVGVVATKAPSSKKLREWNSIFTCCG